MTHATARNMYIPAATIVAINLSRKAAAIAPLGRDHELLSVRDGGEALQMARAAPPALFLINHDLPDGSGIELCRRIKGDPELASIRVIIVAHQEANFDRMACLEAGADDCVADPLFERELELRARAVLRRNETPCGSQVLEVGGVRVNLDSHRVEANGDEVDLTALEFRLISLLVSSAGRVLTRQALVDQIWSARREVGRRTVDVHMGRLRAKLADAARNIETVRGVGYRFADGTGTNW